MTRRGYLYVAAGRRYVEEAVSSARSLRRVDEGASVTLVTDKPMASDVFDDVVIRPMEVDSWKAGLAYKVRHIYDGSAYDRVFFVDTDTYFCGDCSELFALLDYYDLCIADAPNDTSEISLGNGPLKGYYPYNTGVIVFRKSDVNRELFRKWFDVYQAKVSRYQHDQGPLMEALLESRSRVYVLRNVYNARPGFHVSFMAGEVKLIHGRPDDLERVRAVLNATPVNRSWDPVAQACRPVGVVRYLKSYARYLRKQASRSHD
jgi:hypothetical protein